MVMAPRVSSYMSSPVVTIKPVDSLAHARNLMIRHRIGRIIVIDEAFKPVGIITKHDFLKIVVNRRKSSRPLDSIPVEEVMTPNPLVIKPSKTVKAAAEIMLRRKIGGLPVVEDDKLVGIITRTDLVRAYADKYKGYVSVEEAMRRDIPVVSRTHNVSYVASLIESDESGKVIVVEANKPIGVITKSDIAFIEPLVSGDKYYKKTSILPKGRVAATRLYLVPVAEDLMTPNPLTVRPSEDLAMAAESMIKNNIGVLPVVDEDGYFLGAVTRIEILKALASM